MRYNDEETGHGAEEAAPAPDQNATLEEVDALATRQSNKSPAFQFYPEAWFSSSKVQRMSHTERGIYMDLLARCWLDHGLPTDLNLLAAMLRMPAKRFERIWAGGALHECFYERNGRFHNHRLDIERRKQVEFRRSKQDAAHVRWSKDRDARAMPSISISDRISNSDPDCTESAEPHSDSSPAVLTFPTIGKGPKVWALTEAQVADWVAAYPGIDVRGQCHRALAWVKANGSKTAKGMPAFLVRWLNNSTDRGARPVLAATGTHGRGRTGAPPAGKYDGIEES